MSEARNDAPDILNSNGNSNPKPSKQNTQVKLVIIGAGPGGYAAAIRASQFGASVTLIERAQAGGTCLNWGCIPSKIMRRAADIADAANNTAEAELFGVKVSQLHTSPQGDVAPQAPVVDLALLRARQRNVINAQVNGLARHFKALGINLINGEAQLQKLGEVAVTLPDGSVQHFAYDHLLLAIGSAPASLPGLEIDGNKIISSNHALWMEKLPKSMLVVGGGVIGCELAQIFHSFGVKVTLVEALPRLLPLPALDEEITKTYARSLKKAKLPFYVGHTVAEVTPTSNGLIATIRPLSASVTSPNSGLEPALEPTLAPALTCEKEQGFNLEVEQILVATGRKSIAASLSPQGLDGLRALGLKLDARGWIEAGPDFCVLNNPANRHDYDCHDCHDCHDWQDWQQTNNPHSPHDAGGAHGPDGPDDPDGPHSPRTGACSVWAIGDCLGPARVMLAHVATAEGMAAVENMFAPQAQKGRPAKNIDYSLVPSAIFTAPEIASAGLSLAQAQAQTPGSKAHDFLFRQLGKAQAMNETDGLTRLVCAPDGTILGGQIIGPCATSLIGEIGLAVQQGLKAEDLANTIHAHPTLPEGIWEAALSACGNPLHGN